MSESSSRLRKILLKNKAALGLNSRNLKAESSDSDSDSSENSDAENSILDTTLTPESQEELVLLVKKLSLENSNCKMENIRFFTSLLPTFSGNQDHLESFIIAIDEFHSLYHTVGATEDQKKVVLAAIKSKLVDDAKHFLLSRPDLSDWPSIKNELRTKFGDPITYLILMQQLQYFKINKNEGILQFVDRLKSFAQRIISKINCEVDNNAAKALLISQIENTSVLILTANSPQTLKTMLMLQRPATLNDAYTHVLNFNMIESQVNFTNQNSVFQNPFKNNSQNSNNNQHRPTNSPFFNPQRPMPIVPRYQPFPSQPIFVQPRPVQRHYPTNAQVFGQQTKPSFAQNKPPKQDAPIPMSISTAGPSRIQQHRQPPPRYPNFFQSTGPRNFVSQELSNVEIQEACDTYQPLEPPQTSYPEYLENQPYTQYYNPDFESQNHPDQNLGFEQNFENSEENSQNFQNLASDPKLT